MGKFHDALTPEHIAFIEKQHMFFVATAPLSADGHINVSPKGLDSFKVFGNDRVGYMDLIGSGDETSAHAMENGRITVMFCSFEKVPNILRIYGKARTILRDDPEWDEVSAHFTIYPSTRQVITVDVTKVQTSCGYGIPFYEYKGERSIHFDWAEKKGPEGLEIYMDEKNTVSIDGLPTPLKK
jgi:hypothetical protein